MFYKTLLLTTTTLIYDAVWSHQKTKYITEHGMNVSTYRATKHSTMDLGARRRGGGSFIISHNVSREESRQVRVTSRNKRPK